MVKEKLLCHAIIGKAGGKELIMRVPLSCEFITPLLEFSSDTLNFRVDKVRRTLIEKSQSQNETRTETRTMMNKESCSLTLKRTSDQAQLCSFHCYKKFLVTDRKGKVMFSQCLSGLNWSHGYWSLLILVMARSVRILLECFLVLVTVVVSLNVKES